MRRKQGASCVEEIFNFTLYKAAFLFTPLSGEARNNIIFLDTEMLFKGNWHDLVIRQ